VHVLPFVLYGRDPLGYDTGFYRRYLIEPFLSIPNAQVPGLGNDALVLRVLLDSMRLTHLPTDVILYGTYAFLFALLPAIVFWFLRPHIGVLGSAISGFFILSSPVLYNAYWYMLFKNALALDLIFLAYIAFDRRAVRTALVLDMAIALTHETSAIIYLLSLACLFCIHPERRRELVGHIGLTFGVFALVNISLVHQVEIALPTALFIEWAQYLWLSVPFLILIVCGWRALYQTTTPRTLLSFAFVSVIYPVLHLPFYERIFVFSDVALAALAGICAAYMLAQSNLLNPSGGTYMRMSAICIALGLLFGNLYVQVQSLQPLISYTSIQQIQAIGAMVPADAFILTSANEAPWYEGWTQAHIAAPGLLHDTHNLLAWESLWDATTSAAQVSFLSTFPQPLYISTLGPFSDLIGNPAPCLKEIAPHLLYDACNRAGE